MSKVNVISLGCSKNLVDSELLIKQLESLDYAVEFDMEDSDASIVVVNTCGFIGDAKEESIETILEQTELKKKGVVKQIYVMGCLSQRYKEDLESEIPEVDAWFGKFDWSGIINKLGKEYNQRLRNERYLTTPSHYAYLKISEGCDRGCSYCAIPLMTGKHISREFNEIVFEAEKLAAKGVKELLIIAQDSTYYGVDRYGKNRLAELVDRLADIPGIAWIRIHYAYPAGFPIELLKVMRERKNVCNYLDIALQHCSDHMLNLMRRGITKEQTINLIKKIREEVPGIAVRTTVMTGHPGETEEDFNELKEFIKEMQFERLGVFAYSHEEDTYCDKNYKDDIPEDIKQQRADTIMEIQQIISAKHNECMIGKSIRVLIDRKEDNYWIGRSEYDSPEVDPEVIITSTKPLEIGSFYNITITDADDYDLFAEAK